MTTSFDLEDRVALVTGGSKGIGRSIAADFLKAGARVAICARSEPILSDPLLDDLFIKAKSENRLLFLSTDATEEKSVQEAVKKAVSYFGRIDVLVNNVGGAIRFGSLFSLTKEDWQRAFELNVQSMVFFSKEAIPYLKESKFPRIINISSISGMEPGYFNPHYSSTKASTINISKHLANVLANDKILVNCVCPGSTFSDSWTKNIESVAQEKGLSYEEVEKDFIEAETKKIPLGRIGSGEDISKIVLFLASSEASWITGSCFHLNGGKMRSIS